MERGEQLSGLTVGNTEKNSCLHVSLFERIYRAITFSNDYVNNNQTSEKSETRNYRTTPITIFSNSIFRDSNRVHLFRGFSIIERRIMEAKTASIGRKREEEKQKERDVKGCSECRKEKCHCTLLKARDEVGHTDSVRSNFNVQIKNASG